jgi:hypothetical protein
MTFPTQSRPSVTSQGQGHRIVRYNAASPSNTPLSLPSPSAHHGGSSSALNRHDYSYRDVRAADADRRAAARRHAGPRSRTGPLAGLGATNQRAYAGEPTHIDLVVLLHSSSVSVLLPRVAVSMGS